MDVKTWKGSIALGVFPFGRAGGSIDGLGVVKRLEDGQEMWIGVEKGLR